MDALYEAFSKVQKDSKFVYEGLMFRTAIDNIKHDATLLDRFCAQYKKVIFAGFNVLNEVEHQLMAALHARNNAVFYWDYDISYVNNPNNEAGFFIRKNLQDFPSVLSKAHFDNISKIKSLTIVSTTSNNAEARYLHEWIGNGTNPVENKNAIVLCDERLLQPVLHVFPDVQDGAEEPSIKSVNITMGFSFMDTPLYGLIMSLLSMQIDGYDVKKERFSYLFERKVLNHPFTSFVSKEKWRVYAGSSNLNLLDYLIDILNDIGLHFSKSRNLAIYDQLYVETVFVTLKTLNKLKQKFSEEADLLQVSPTTFRQIVKELLHNLSIPFHGEPALGIQVMGLLETRCLDFSHLIMLSVEEDILPKSRLTPSFIPVNIREAFGLTTPRHKNAVYAYYFYRLIQRAEHVTCVYNENTSGNAHHEISRFLLQLLAETKVPIQKKWIRTTPTIEIGKENDIQKDEDVMTLLRENLDATYSSNVDSGKKVYLSPSAINTYMRCPFLFYLQRILHIKAEEDLSESIEPKQLGDIFHNTAMLVYHKMMEEHHSQTIDKPVIQRFLSDMELHVGPLLDLVFDAVYFHPVDEWDMNQLLLQKLSEKAFPQDVQYAGESVIVRMVIMTYLKNLLEFDLKRAPFQIVGMEVDAMYSITLNDVFDTPVTVNLGGRIDRIDVQHDTLRIVDYKTGSKEVKAIKNMDALMKKGKDHPGYVLQILLYSLAYSLSKPQSLPIQPVLFFLSKAYEQDYDPKLEIEKLEITDFEKTVKEEFQAIVSDIVKEIFDIRTPFQKCADEGVCSYCEYRLMCKNY